MENTQNLENKIKFRPDYQWPKEDAKRDCPRCGKPMQLQEDLRDYYGKPWWCTPCKWQFSEEDIESS